MTASLLALPATAFAEGEEPYIASAADFAFNSLTGDVTATTGVIQASGFSVRYTTVEGEPLDEKPLDAGTYIVFADVPETEATTAVTDITGLWIYKIECPGISVSETGGGLTYKTASSVNYSISYDNFVTGSSYNHDSVRVEWLDAAPDGITVTLNDSGTRLTLSLSEDTPAGAGEYSFRVTTGKIHSGEIRLSIEKKAVSVSCDVTQVPYSSETVTAVQAGEGYSLSGTASASSVGIYSCTAAISDENNYYWQDGTSGPKTFTWEITKRPVTISGIKVIEKKCDGTCTASFDISAVEYKGILEGDRLSCSVTGSFTTAKVGAGKIVNISVELTGADRDNYYLTDDTPDYLRGNIIKNPVDGSAVIEDSSSENYRNAAFATSDDEVKEILLTDEEKILVKNGAELSFRLDVKDVSSNPPSADAERINMAKGTGTVVSYMDISISRKNSADNSTEKITELDEQVSISFDAPKAATAGARDGDRQYYLIRVHDGDAVSLEGSYDSKTGKITFSTDSFSTYALVYKDKSDEIVRTSDDNNIYVWVLVIIAAIGELAGRYIINKKEPKPKYVGKH